MPPNCLPPSALRFRFTAWEEGELDLWIADGSDAREMDTSCREIGAVSGVRGGAAKEREWELEGGDDGRLGVLPEGEGMQIFLGGDDSF